MSTNPESGLDVNLRPRLSATPIAIGIAAGVIPFFVTVASTTVSTENGQITSATYRDNLAVACGAVALAMAVLAIVSLIRGPRGARAIAAAAVLLALGGYQVAHGFGAFFKPEVPEQFRSAPEEAAAAARAAETPAAAAAPAQPKLARSEALGIARRVFGLWRPEKLDELLSELAFQSKGARLQMKRMYELFDERLGKVVGPKDAAVHDDGTIHGTLAFERGEADYVIVLGEAGRAAHVAVHSTDEDQAKLAAGATMASADAAAREVIGALFAGKLDRALALLDPQLIANLDDDADARLAALVKQVGRLQKITTRTQRACGNLAGPAFCFEYALKTARDVVTATFELWLDVGRWQVRSFNLEPTKR